MSRPLFLRVAAVATAALLSHAAPAFAQDATAPPPDAAELGGDSLTIGIGAAYLPDYEGSNDYRFVPGPLVLGQYKGFSFSVLGNRASIDLIPNHPGDKIDLQLGPIGVVNFNRSSNSSIDDPRVGALTERKTAIELGGYVGIGKTGIITSPYDKLSVSVSYRHDVSGVHDSGIWQPSINYLTPLSRKAAIGLFGSAQYADRQYAQTYFGITTAESLASGLPAYTAHKGWKNYTVGGALTYALTGDLLHGFKLVAGGTYTRLLNTASYSPITRIAGTPNQWLGAAGVAYTF